MSVARDDRNPSRPDDSDRAVNGPFALSSLRYRLLLLVLLAELPALALIVSTAWEQQRQAAVGAQEDALRLARLAATDHERLIEATRSLLTGLAQLSDVQMHNSKACSALFAEVQRRFPLYTNVGAIRPDGRVFCAARGLQGSRNVGDQPFFQHTLAAQEFTVSGYVQDPRTGKPTLTLSLPAIDTAGAVWAVVFAELDLAWMGQLAEKAQLPAGTVLTVNDTAGRVLARYPDPGNWVGKLAPGWAVVEATRASPREGTLQARGLEGVDRLTAFTPLFDAKRSQSAYVSVGIPRQAVLADANRLLLRNLMWTGLVIVLTLIAATTVSDLFILRRVNAVVRAARRLTAGDLSARAAVGGADEIGLMARTFNVMAERLQTRARDEQTTKEVLAERVNELDVLNEVLRNQSIHDPLTGLFNRRYMEETLEREVHRARRNGSPMSALMVDVDGFKQQNDAFGHDAGDVILRELATLLQARLRKEDIACRYGGEEFVLVLPDASLESAARRAEQFRVAVKEMRLERDGVMLGPITVSIGLAAFPEHGGDAKTLLKAADAALYQAKREGRDRVSVATARDEA